MLTWTVSLFKSVPVATMLAQNLLFGIVYYSQLYYLPLFFQNAHQLTPTISAVLLLPLTGAQMVASITAGRYISWKERYGEIIWVGFFCWTLGVGLTCSFDVDTPKYGMALVLFVEGIGIGCIFQPTIVALQAHCTKAQRAVVISNRNFIRALGGSIGLAISATIMQNKLQQHMPAKFVALSQMAYHTPDLNKIGATPTQKQDILHAYAQASRAVFIMNVPFIGLCLLGCVLIKDRGLQRPDEVELENSSAHSSNQTLVQEADTEPTIPGAPAFAQDTVSPSRISSNRKLSQGIESEK
jgi:MFS family permease